ncbi:MAG: hypothetical protein ACK6CU_11395 [Deltaproteobacteria bacterium]
MTHRSSRDRGRRGARSQRSFVPDPFDSFSDPRASMLASEAREALALALATLEDPALDEVRLVSVRADGKEVHATLACPAACHEAARDALERVRGRLRTDLAESLDRRRAPTLALALATEEELAHERGEP